MSEEVTPSSVLPKKKKKFGLFRRKKKSKEKPGEASPEGSLEDNDSGVYEFSDLEEESDVETEEDDDKDTGSGIVAPGLHYTAPPNRSKSTLTDGSRGRDVTRGRSEIIGRSRSRSRSRSVSSAFRKLMGGSQPKSTLDIGTAQDFSASQRKVHPSPEDTSGSLGNSVDEPSATRKPKSKKKKKRDSSSSLGGSLTGIEISVHDDDSVEPLPTPSKKKKKSKKTKDKDSLDDDDTASRDSLPPLSKKKSSRRKKASSTDGSSAGDSSSMKKIKKKNSKRDFDVVNRAMQIKQQRVSIQNDLKDTVRQREKRAEMMREFKDHAGSSPGDNWENEEYLLSPKPEKSGRSMLSESSQKRSMGTLSTEMDGSLLVENENAVTALSETVATLSKQVGSQRKENSKLQRSLADALQKVAKLNEDLRAQGIGSAELKEVKKELEYMKTQNEKLHKALDKVEMELSTKDDQVDSMEQLVEEQVERVRFLENKLDETEDELFKMEVEMKKAGSMVTSSDNAPSQDHTEKVNSIRAGRMQRMASKKNFGRGNSVRDLISGSLDKSTHNRKASDLASRERKLEERERQIQVGRERDQSREQRLKEWEEELLEKEKVLRAGSDPMRGDVLDSRERDLEERERLLKADLEKLQQDRGKLTKLGSNIGNGQTLVIDSEDEKDLLINDLKAECQELLTEKQELIKKHEEEERQREEDLQIIQKDIDEKICKLDDENEELRQRLEEADSRAPKAEEYRKTISKLETEIVILQKASSTDGNQADVLRELQEEVTLQLTALDEENRKLSARLKQEQEKFQKQLDEKEDDILELEETIERLEKEKESGDKTRAERESAEKISQELADAFDLLREKQSEIETLQKKLGLITEEFEQRNAQELLGKNAIIQQLEEELTATKAVIEAKTSDQWSMEMKAEIKALRENIRDLNKRLKKEQHNARSKIKKLDAELCATQREASRMKQELERNEHRDQKRAALKNQTPDEDLKQHLEDLEDEVDHWKKVNIELEDELAHWKSEANALKMQIEDEEDQDLDDNASVGSFVSQVSRQSMHAHRRGSMTHGEPALRRGSLSRGEPMHMSHHSFSSVSREDMFFAPKTGVSDSASEAEASSSQRAMRTVTDLWSKMTTKQPSGPSGLYQMNLDD